MTDIYEQHKAAFAHVSAFVVCDRVGERVATVAIRYPKSGLRLWAYVHLIGVEMVRASAGGGGYDKASAAVADALAKIPAYPNDPKADGYGAAINAARSAFRFAIIGMDSKGWLRRLEDGGFRVFQAV